MIFITSIINEEEQNNLKNAILNFSGHTIQRKTNLYNLISTCLSELNISIIETTTIRKAVQNGKNKLYIHTPNSQYKLNKHYINNPELIYLTNKFKNTNLDLLPLTTGLPIQFVSEEDYTIVGFDPINNILILPPISTMLSIPIEIKIILEKIMSGDICSIGNIIGSVEKRHVSNVNITYEIMPKHKLNNEVNKYKKYLSKNYKQRIENISTLLNKKIKEVECNLERLPDANILNKNKLICLVPTSTSSSRNIIIGKPVDIKVISLEFSEFSLNMIPLNYHIKGILGGVFDSHTLNYKYTVCIEEKLKNGMYVQTLDNPHVHGIDMTAGMCTGDADIPIHGKNLEYVINYKWFEKLESQTKKINMTSLANSTGYKFNPIYDAATNLRSKLETKIPSHERCKNSNIAETEIKKIIENFNESLKLHKDMRIKIIKELFVLHGVTYNLNNDSDYITINNKCVRLENQIKLAKGITFGVEVHWGSRTSRTDSRGWSTRSANTTTLR